MTVEPPVPARSRLLRPPEAALMVGKSEQTLRDWRYHQVVLEYLRDPATGSIFYEESVILAYLDGFERVRCAEWPTSDQNAISGGAAPVLPDAAATGAGEQLAVAPGRKRGSAQR